MAEEEVLRLGVDPRPGEVGFARFSRAASGATGAAGQVTAALGVLGGAMAAFAGARGVGAAISAAIDWEMALTGVAKTVEATEERIAQLGAELQDLSTTIPVTAGELAGVAEAAGQLGIQTDNIVAFTRVMADLGVATNLSAEQAATSLARLANVMGTPQDAFDRLGSTIVDLGNNLATTEAEITEFATRMAGAGRIAGLTEANILAIGGAMSSVGIEAEAGGTAVQKALIEINTAVAQGNENLARFAATASMSAADFESLWERDAASAFQAFVEGLDRAGDDAVTVLEELGLRNQRLVRAFLSLANAGPLLGDALGRANTAWEENNALTEEAEMFYATLGNQIQTLKNQVAVFAADLGEELTPAIGAAIENVDLLVDSTKALVIVVGSAGAVAAFSALAPAVWGSVAAFAALVPAVNSVASAVGLLQIALGPAGWLVLGLSAATAGLTIFMRQSREMREEMERQEQAVRDAAGAIGELDEAATRATLSNLGQAASRVQAEIARLKSEIADAPGPTGRGTGGTERAALQAQLREQQKILEGLEPLIAAAGKRWTEFGAEAEAAGDAVSGVATAAGEVAGALDDEIDLLSRAVEFEETRAEAVQRLADIHAELLDASRNQADLDEDRIRNLERMAEIARTIADLQSLSLDSPVQRNRNLEPGGRQLGASRGHVSLDPGFAGIDPAVFELGKEFEAEVARVAARLREEFGELGDSMDELSVADAVVGGLASVLDHLNLMPEAARGFVRGVSDIMSGLQSAQKVGGGFDFSGIGGVGSALGIAGGVAGILGTLFSDDDAQRIREARNNFEDALDDFVSGLTDQTRWEALEENALDEAIAVAEAMVDAMIAEVGSDKARELFGQAFDEIFRQFERGQITFEEFSEAMVDLFGDDAQAVFDAYHAHMERIEEQRQKEIAAMEDDFRVRALVAQGRDEEAEALRRDIKQRKEIAEAMALGDTQLVAFIESVHEFEDAALAAADAAEAAAEAERQRADFQGTFRAAAMERARRTGDVDALRSLGLADIEATLAEFADVAGITDQQITLLAATMRGNLNAAIEDMIEAEERRARQQAHAADQFLQDIRARELALQGDDAGALEAQLRAEADAEMFRAQEMLRAGDISREAFERLAAVIEGELAQALEEAERAAREAAEAERFRAMVDKENLRVRLLVAQGQDEEAQRLRNQLEIMEAINEGRDAEYIALLRQIHAVELHNQAQEEAARAIEDTTRKLDGMTRWMNSPSGFFTPQLLRNQTIMGSDVFGVQQPQFGGTASSGGGETSITIEGPVTIQAAPGDTGADLWSKLETEAQQRARSTGSNPFQTLGTG